MVATLGARPRRGRLGTPRRSLRAVSVPYLLILPALVVLALVVAWPLVKIITLSLQKQDNSKYALFHGTSGGFVWFQNYVDILTESTFWAVLLRSLVFMVVSVGVSLVLGTAIAALLNRASTWARLVLTAALLFVWAVPSTVSTQVFYWLFNNQYGAVNYLLSGLPGLDLAGHDWFANANEGLAVVAVIVVWGALPLLAISLHAGMTQIPPEVIEAAKIDGAGSWQIFRHIVLPYLGPLLLVLTTLSIIWDFGVFNQIWFLRNGHPEPGYQTIGIYMYSQGIGSSHYNTGSAIGVLMMTLLLGVMVVYIRQLFRIGDAE
jgi:N,N'-diacetylchitobiose transport system permease protein